MACSECGYSIPELEPRLFTFNNPAGACPECEGLGVKQYVDVSKLIHEPTASLSEGAIVGWDVSHRYHFHLLRCLSREYSFSLETPFEDLTKETRDLILNGSNGVPVNFSWRNKRGSLVERIFPFEGVVNNIDRRYKETESSWSRDNLSKLISLASCKACEGTRLRKEARNVFLENVNLPEITSYTAQGNLFGAENGRLPTPNMLMFDRITEINQEGGKFSKGQIVAELDINPDLWFFDCHFKGDPV